MNFTTECQSRIDQIVQLVDSEDKAELIFRLALSEAEMDFKPDMLIPHPSGAYYKEIGALRLGGRLHELYWVLTRGPDGTLWVSHLWTRPDIVTS